MNSQNTQDQLDFSLNSYNYEIDSSLIANRPMKVRHKSKMMIVKSLSSKENYCVDKLTENIIDEISAGDLVIVNDTKVMKARLDIKLENDTNVELLILEKVEASVWLCLAKPGKKLKVNNFVMLISKNNNINIQLEIVGIDKETGGRLIKFPNDIDNLDSMNKLLNKCGRIPLPPYIKVEDESLFHENSYQTQYARNPGAVAAPTAGLHLSKDIIQKLTNKGIKILSITLHVGYGTFKPVEQENLKELKLHKEFVNVEQDVINEIKKVKGDEKKFLLYELLVLEL